MILRTVLILTLVVTTLACGDDDSSSGDVTPENPDLVAGCRHLQNGPDVPLSLTGDMGAASTTHTRYSLSLGSGDDGFSGQFTWTSGGGRHYFLFSRPTTMMVRQAENSAVSTLATYDGIVPGCDAAASAYEFMLPEGSYEISIVSDEADLLMSIQKAGEQHDHGGHHGHGDHDDDHGH